jgi:hypothetical protein
VLCRTVRCSVSPSPLIPPLVTSHPMPVHASSDYSDLDLAPDSLAELSRFEDHCFAGPSARGPRAVPSSTSDSIARSRRPLSVRQRRREEDEDFDNILPSRSRVIALDAADDVDEGSDSTHAAAAVAHGPRGTDSSSSGGTASGSNADRSALAQPRPMHGAAGFPPALTPSVERFVAPADKMDRAFLYGAAPDQDSVERKRAHPTGSPGKGKSKKTRVDVDLTYSPPSISTKGKDKETFSSLPVLPMLDLEDDVSVNHSSLYLYLSRRRD